MLVDLKKLESDNACMGTDSEYVFRDCLIAIAERLDRIGDLLEKPKTTSQDISLRETVQRLQNLHMVDGSSKDTE